MAEVKITVLVDAEHRECILDVADQLQATGMTVAHCMEHIGVISGSMEATQMAKLSQVTGVAAVEPEQTYQLNPPDSEVQ